MITLFDRTRIGTMQLRNRLVRSATGEAIGDETGRMHLLRCMQEAAGWEYLSLQGIPCRGVVITMTTYRRSYDRSRNNRKKKTA